MERVYVVVETRADSQPIWAVYADLDQAMRLARSLMATNPDLSFAVQQHRLNPNTDDDEYGAEVVWSITPETEQSA